MIDATWDEDYERYVVDPSVCDCDCNGTGDGEPGWWSADGDFWMSCGGGTPEGDFGKITLRLVGGPRHGTLITDPDA